jgi:eukaryotic-like serine/threonine-protein kinase
MNGLATPNDDCLTPADLEQVIAVCEQFEEAWKQGRTHRIEDFQGEVPAPLRPRLFRELLALEVELRQARGEHSGQEEYRVRFPELAESISEVFAAAGDVDSWPSRLPSTAGRPTDDRWPVTVSGSAPLAGSTATDFISQPNFQPTCSAATDTGLLTETVADDQTADELGPVRGRRDAKLDRTNSIDRTHPAYEVPGKVGEGVTLPPASVTQSLTPTSTGSSSWVGEGGYELLEEIGRGGMGVVYKARHRGLHRLVALKLIREGARARPDLLARLRTEAEAVARLRHENIVQVYDVGEMDGDPFVALEFLEGGNLSAKLAGTPQPDRLAAEMSRTLARAIHAAHLVGVVHRDLKPLNVLLNESGQLKIADFGLAKILGDVDGKTVSGVPLGTPSYMAPEQAGGRSKQVGPAADIYALGAILYEMLTGRPPFKGLNAHVTIHQVIHDEPVPPSRLQSHVSRDLETICLKCLEKEPHRRYASAADLADDLDRYLDGRPIRARRTPAWEVGVKWARRHPATTTLAALGLAASVALAASGVWYQDHLRRRDKDDNAHLAVRLSEGTSKLLKGQDELARGRPDDAKLTLSNLLTETKDEPRRLADLHRRAMALLTQADTAIKRTKDDAKRRADEEQAQERYRQFHAKKDTALYHETQFAGLDPSASRDATRASAEAALAVFGTPRADDGWSLGPLPESLSPAERHDVEEGCYVLLLILAGAEDQPKQGLRSLASAARLRPPTLAYQQRLADCLARRGDNEGATKARLEAERLTPETAFDHFLTGLERYGRREWAGALGHFDAALRLQPDHFWANALSAICCLQLEPKRAGQAKAHLSAALQREPEFAWLYVLRGFASYQAAALERDAAKARQPSGETSPTKVEPRFEPAEADYRTAEDLLAKTPNAELHYVLLVNRGLLRLERRDWDGAVGDLEAAIRLDGRHYLAYATLAEVYQRRRKPDEAIAQFGRAIAVRPDLAALYRGRADVDLKRKDPTAEQRARALRDLDQAIRLETPGKPVLARDQTSRGLLFFLAHDDAAVLVACNAALAVVPDHAEAHLLRVRSLLRLKRYDEALRSCDALLSRGKPLAEVYEFRRLAREGLDDFAGAIEDVTHALSLRPGEPALLARRGELYLIENSPLLAVRDFEEAVKLDPSLADARAGLGTARVRLGRYHEAVADADAAARLGASEHRVLYKAARVYALAAVAASFEVRRKGQDTVALVAHYQDRAIALVGATRALVPAAERANFEAVLRTDPAIATIRRRLRPAGPPAAGTHTITELSLGTSAE